MVRSNTDGLTDEPVLTENARKVLAARYLKKDETGACLEKPEDLFRRVSGTIADVETEYGATPIERQRWEGRFYKLLATGAFMPNSPTLMNAGREMGMLSACFVLPVRDSVVDIFNSIKHTALIQKAGGGTGFAFDELRPTGDFIRSSGGTTSGPISFWRAFSEATSAIQQGAFRRGANMGMMYIHHPDILKFLHAKQDLTQFTNYNISVKVTDAWMEEFLADPDSPHVVRNPRTGRAYALLRDIDVWHYDVRDLITVECVEPVPESSRKTYYETPRLTGPLPDELAGKVYTKQDIWNIVVENAWQTGEPGVVFIDRINQHNPTPKLGRMEATNPCGEQPLLPYEACNLGSINLGLYVQRDAAGEPVVDWDGLREAIHVAARFLDNVIDANNYPLPEIERICHDNRKIGLGVMGFADALYKLGVPYNSEEGVAWGRRFMQFLNDEAHQYSESLARERGCFANWQGSTWHANHKRMMRNAATTTVAPTGTISIIANCSGGIEPLFSLAFMRNVLRDQKQRGKPLIEINDAFREVAIERGFYSDELMERIVREGTLAGIEEVPDDVKRVFVCAHDITPEWHMRMQAAFQEHCDASISKTINFPHSATKDDVTGIYNLAYELGCKGVTVYRDGCRSHQPMALKKDKAKEQKETVRSEECETKPANEALSEAAHQSGAARKPSETHEMESPVTAAAPALGMSEPTERPRRIEPMDLPEIVSGLRVRQMTPFGNMHVKITVDPRSNRELEIFAQLGKGGDVANSDLEAICRTASLWLRAGGDLRPLIKQWEGIGSSLQIPTRSGRIMSLPDGLACAVKKYVRAKEQFGLQRLLLGEIDLAELDNPDRAPHHPQTKPVDRPITSAPLSDRGNGGAKKAIASAGVAPTLQPVREVSERSPGNGGGASSTPRASHGTNGNGNGHGRGNGNGHALLGNYGTSTISVGTMDHEVEAAPAPEVRTQTAVLERPKASADPAAVTKRVAGADLSSVLASVRHTHDAAAYYKILCPECHNPLLLQEGCRKCPSCGWAAC